MKTIEERAAHYVSVHVCANKQTYIDGAIEQKEIDIDKACEWLKDNIRKDLTIGTYADTVESLIEDFRKAMEK